MKDMAEILGKMVQACPVGCSVAIRKYSEEPEISLVWWFTNGAKQRCIYEHKFNLFELQHFNDIDVVLQYEMERATVQIRKQLAKVTKNEYARL